MRPRLHRAAARGELDEAVLDEAEAFFDTEAGAWEVEPITYDVAAGPSSRDLPLTDVFNVTAVGPWSAE